MNLLPPRRAAEPLLASWMAEVSGASWVVVSLVALVVTRLSLYTTSLVCRLLARRTGFPVMDRALAVCLITSGA